MEIRKSTLEDVDRILEIFAIAKGFMDAQGNTTQWEPGYPGRAVLEQDVEQGNSYVLEDNGKVVGTFAFILGEDPTYQVIEQGAWHSTKPYGTIHRVASDGSVKGIARTCFAYGLTKVDYLRVDTHQNNRSMQAAIRRFGFRECGIIHVRDGSPRIAFDYLKQ